jgi:hypothetical protein
VSASRKSTPRLPAMWHPKHNSGGVREAYQPSRCRSQHARLAMSQNPARRSSDYASTARIDAVAQFPLVQADQLHQLRRVPTCKPRPLGGVVNSSWCVEQAVRLCSSHSRRKSAHWHPAGSETRTVRSSNVGLAVAACGALTAMILGWLMRLFPESASTDGDEEPASETTLPYPRSGDRVLSRHQPPHRQPMLGVRAKLHLQ